MYEYSTFAYGGEVRLVAAFTVTGKDTINRVKTKNVANSLFFIIILHRSVVFELRTEKRTAPLSPNKPVLLL